MLVTVLPFSVSKTESMGLFMNPDANWLGLFYNHVIAVGESTKWPNWFFYPNCNKCFGSFYESTTGHSLMMPSEPDDNKRFYDWFTLNCQIAS